MASIADALQEALRHHRAGALAEAEILYRRILAVEPAQADALNLLARLCLQTDRAAAALDLAAQAVRGAPSILSYQLTLADCARVLGQPGPLIAALTAAAALAPDRADLCHQLGLALAGQGALDEALTALTEARRRAPADAAILNDGAVLLARAGRAAEAEHWLDQALALGDAQAAANLHGLMLAQASLRLDDSLSVDESGAAARAEAERLSRRAVALAPDDARGWLLLGQALAAASQLDAAWDAYRRARDLGGDAVETAIVAGDCLTRLGRFDGADALLRPALAAHPDDPSLLNNTGILRHCQGRLDEARSLFERAIAAAPADHRPLVNLGTLLKDIGDDAGADLYLRRALVLAPADPAAHWQYALARLMAGDFATGWREYEWRWRTGKLTPGAALPALPSWPARLPAGDPPPTGSPLAGLRVLVECEQGHGDTLHFIRYVPRLRALGAVVGVAAQPALVRLLTLSLPGVPVSALPAGPPPGVWDCRVPLMSLPYRLAPWLGADFIPADVPYLFPDAGEAAAWRHRLAGPPADAMPGGAMKVGLVWAGDPRRDDPSSALIDKRRSVSPATLAPLAAIPGITWISLQKGVKDWPLIDWPLIDWTGELGDFADTAALVAGLDLVITVDTAVAHLAGGLGRPVWVLSRYDGCWRWQHRRDDSPWYPTLRLFRQTDWHDWSAAVAALARALAGIDRAGTGHRAP